MNPQSAIDVLSRTVYGEARNQTPAGMAAVAWVVRNRSDYPRWWGHSIPTVCLCPWQFSCWNPDDPNRSIIESVDASNPTYCEVIQICGAVIEGRIPDPTKGADSYFAVGSDAPVWADQAVFTTQIGAHRFYRTELPSLDTQSTNKSVSVPDQADDLNAAELRRLS